MIEELPCASEQPQIQVEHNHPATQAEQVNVNMTQQKPFQPINFNFPRKRYGKQTRSFQSKWFTEFPWLHYNEQNDSALCFICAQQHEKLNLRTARNKEYAFISDGFSNWKKALTRFKERQISECHKTAVEYHLIPKTCGNVLEMSSHDAKKTMQTNRLCLIKIIGSLRYLARQGQPIQGDTDDESNFIQLLELRGSDEPLILRWLERKGEKYTSHDIQNEIIAIMANHVIRDIVSDIGNGFFSIISDEYTDVSNKEQLTICIRWVDKHLNPHEDFFGFFNIPNISAETIVTAINDVLVRLQLSLANCRGQCYDGASNMLGSKSGVAKRIQELQPKAHATHCHGHSLSLSVKDTTKNCKVISNTMDTAKEIVTLIKFSPKRENLLGEIQENLEEGELATHGIIKLCPTRWTVRASCFQRILDNYSALLQEWMVCLDEKLQADIRGRIIGCQAQMKTYDFFFGLNLGERLFSHTDNLSKTLQSTKMCAASGQRLANLTKEVLQKIRSDESFILFYEAILIKSKNIPSISEPTLPRKRRAPARFEIGTGMPSYPTTSQDYYRQIYFECIDFMINAIEQRFNQPSFSVYEQMESFLLKVLNDQDYSTELQFLEDNYSGDLDIGALKSQLEIFKLLLKDADCVCFYDMLVKIRELPEPEKKMISHIITICKLIQVNPATSASAERSFSAARRLKTWLRSTMSQERLNNLTVINEHKERTDGLCLVDIANEFCERNENRKRNFGRFVESDCYQHSNICAICQKEALG